MAQVKPKEACPGPGRAAAEGPAATQWPMRETIAKWSVGCLESALNDQIEVQIPAAIRRLKDSAGQFQGGI